MVQRYAHIAEDFAAQYAGNAKPISFGELTQNWHNGAKRLTNEVAEKPLESLGWLMGLEPTTTGITIREINTPQAFVFKQY
jgi:hypothetical protein